MENKGNFIKYFFFDTETTGTDPNYDYIIQFGGIFGLYNKETKEFIEQSRINQLINVNVQIPEGATAIHGIKNEHLVDYNYIDTYIFDFLSFLKKADVIVGHNVTFDISMLKGETQRLGIPFDFDSLEVIDTMTSTTNIVKIESPRGGYKRPKLIELHRFLFGKDFDNAHDAMADIEATKNCFLKLINNYEYIDGEFISCSPTSKKSNTLGLSENSIYRDFANDSDWIKNKEAIHLLKLLSEGKKSIFLTGKAGTGKSTLIRGIIEVNKKLNRYPVILGSTGISALNIGGKTVHSFFGLGRSDIYYKDISKIKKLKISSINIKILKQAPFVIIDEVSMLHSNVLDVIDALMKKTLRNDSPFGGKQIIFVGDIYQLPPVCKPERVDKFGEFYKSERFFHSEVFKTLQYEVIELKHNYRQSEDKNLSVILDHIRDGKVTQEDINQLNACKNNENDEDSIVLFSHNYDVDRYNREQLNKLPGIEYVVTATSSGDFPDQKPIQESITIKEGAKIMMITNDQNGRWVNGSTGIIKEIEVNDFIPYIIVEIDGEDYEINRYTRENAPLVYNETKGVFEEEIKGTYTQFPIKLAYAITIHKSQGLTFEHCKMDIGKVFAGGQAYTALSRVKSLSGLTITGFVSKDRLFFDQRINEFNKNIEISNEWKNLCKQLSKSPLLDNYTRALYNGGNNIYIICYGYEDKIELILSKFTNAIRKNFDEKFGLNVVFFFDQKDNKELNINTIKNVEKIENNKQSTEKIEEKICEPEFDEELFENLRELRNKVTDGKFVYMFASDAVLKLLATYKPVNKEQFISIPGLKETKYEKYGKDILDLIINHLEKQGVDITEKGKEIFDIKRKKIVSGNSKHNLIITVENFSSTKMKSLMTIILGNPGNINIQVFGNEMKVSEKGLNELKKLLGEETKIESEQSKGKNYMQTQKEKHANAYAKRTKEDDDKLIELYTNEGLSIEQLCNIFSRNRGGIRSRLKKLGLDPDI